MKELKILYKELQERQEYLESRKKTKITEGRIAENLLTIVRVQQLLIPLVAERSKQMCQMCKSKKVEKEQLCGSCWSDVNA